MAADIPTFAERDRAVKAFQGLAPPAQWLQIESDAYVDSNRNWGRYMSRMAELTLMLKADPELAELDPAELRTRQAGSRALAELGEKLQELEEILASDAGGFDMSEFKAKQRTCKQCGGLLLVTFKQTRSADEGMTMVTLPCETCMG